MAKKTTSPKGGKRACLCEDGTYSAKCCKGELINQGIGSDQEHVVSIVVNTNEERTNVTTH